MFIYLPLPAYAERYTEYLSVKDGIFEQGLKNHNIEFKAFRRNHILHRIADGIVLDPRLMCEWGFYQTQQVVGCIFAGLIKEGDIIYFEDFWHPGMEMIPYALSLKGLTRKVKLAAFCHAQSVDPNDFTAKYMMPWIRGFEIAWLDSLDYIFVAADYLKRLWTSQVFEAGQNKSKIQVVGTIFDSNYLTNVVGSAHSAPVPKHRHKNVVYSSRLDPEKRPDLFLDIVEYVLGNTKDITFTIASSYSIAKACSNEKISSFIFRLQEKYRGRLFFKTGLTKREYFNLLATSAVQINTALQDFVSYTLLEATTLGCIPFYPDSNETFEDAIGDSQILLYDDYAPLDNIARQLVKLVEYGSTRPVHSSVSKQEPTSDDTEFGFIYQKYNSSQSRMLDILGLVKHNKPAPLEDWAEGTARGGSAWDHFTSRMTK